ncbi:MAG: Ig-like domain-containing protein [Gemmatimonadota bacterium]|nr:Ig-like domain-containing protein [Gemmatimonadota bacterium]
MRRLTTLTILLASAAGVAACGSGGGGADTPVTIVTGNIAYFIVSGPSSKDTLQVLPGGQVQLSGAALDGDLNPVALVGDTTWTSRDTTIARVDAHGLVTASAVGSVWVIGSFTPKASSTSFRDSALVQVLGTQ